MEQTIDLPAAQVMESVEGIMAVRQDVSVLSCT